jgi:CRP-like cAMP-binding protein
MGEHTTVDVVARGGVIGELALLDDSKRMATVIALEPTETLAMHRSEFERVRAEHPSVEAVLVRVLASRIRNLSGQLVDAVYSPVERRLFRRLCMLYDLYADGDTRVTIPLTQEHLADLAGTTRSTVNRILRTEEKQGVLSLERGKVVILDVEGLRKRAR